MKKINTKTRIVQTMCGTLLIAVGMLTAVITDGDITAAIAFVPLGVYAIYTDKIIIN